MGVKGARRTLKYGCCDAAMCACVEGGESGQPSAWREEIGGSGGRSRRAVSVLRRGRLGV